MLYKGDYIMSAEEERKRVYSISLRPSVYISAQKYAQKQGLSLSQAIEMLLSSWLKGSASLEPINTIQETVDEATSPEYAAIKKTIEYINKYFYKDVTYSQILNTLQEFGVINPNTRKRLAETVKNTLVEQGYTIWV
jgi:site-specific recombinase